RTVEHAKLQLGRKMSHRGALKTHSSDALRRHSQSAGSIRRHLDSRRPVLPDADSVHGQFTLFRVKNKTESALQQILEHRPELGVARVATLRKPGGDLIPLVLGPTR